MQSKATTVEQYLRELPEDRRAAIAAVRAMILKNLDKGFREAMSYGMIGYAVPHEIYPPGYHCNPDQPLPFAALASQKNYMSIYLMSLYAGTEQEGRFVRDWRAEVDKGLAKRLDMGKCCIRFKRVEDLAIDVIARHIRGISAKTYIKHYEEALARGWHRDEDAKASTGKKVVAKKTAEKTAKQKARGAVSKKSPTRNASSAARPHPSRN